MPKPGLMGHVPFQVSAHIRLGVFRDARDNATERDAFSAKINISSLLMKENTHTTCTRQT